ncbi:MAG: hypothetical protein ACI8ZN_001456 [Bacteroidia bacterium]|jgi:hypothetical protein
MIKLIESGLFGGNLFAVDKPYLVERYNSCLNAIGLKTTRLDSFHIDGWGWSPEVADELKDSYYLSHGIANPYGIIISPEQADASMYLPYFSFDWDIRKQIYKLYAEQIKDITSDAGIWFSVDQEVTAFRSPQDLLMVDLVQVHFTSTNNIIEAAREQRALIRTFHDDPEAWKDYELRQAIIESSKTHGDLRFRKSELASFPFSNIASFYTPAFDGVYIFRKTKSGKPILIRSGNNSELTGTQSFTHIEFNLNDAELVRHLFAEELLSEQPGFFKQHAYLLEQQLNSMIVTAANAAKHPMPINTASKTRRIGMINDLINGDFLSDAYFELEKLILQLKSDRVIYIDQWSDELRLNLLHPNQNCSSQEKFVLWHLLTQLRNNNPVLTYLFDKARFFKEYPTMREDYQQWTIDQIIDNRQIFHALIS